MAATTMKSVSQNINSWVVEYIYDVADTEYRIGKIWRWGTSPELPMGAKQFIVDARDELEAYTGALRMLREKEQEK